MPVDEETTVYLLAFFDAMSCNKNIIYTVSRVPAAKGTDSIVVQLALVGRSPVQAEGRSWREVMQALNTALRAAGEEGVLG